jgi:pyochelin biosynthetic protein PchC
VLLPLPDGRRPLLLYVAGVGGSLRDVECWTEWLPDWQVAVAGRRPGPDTAPEPSVEERADAFAEVIAAARPPKLIVVGHSLGAIVAYELVSRLERDVPGLVRLLVVASQLPPHRFTRYGAAGLTAAAVVRRMSESVVLPEELAEAPEALASLVPQWRAQLRSLEEYRSEAPRRLTTPVAVWTGRADPLTRDSAALAAWADCSATPPSFREFDGGHDFLFGDREDVRAAIGAGAAAVTV